MKTKIHFIPLLLLVLTASFLCSSCGEEEITIPNVYFKYKMWSYVANGDTLTVDKLVIDEEKSSEGIHIDLINYYFDGEKIASPTSSPYGMKYLIKDKTIGEHELKVYIEVSGDGYAKMKYTLTFTIHVLEEPFNLSFHCNFDKNFGDKTPTYSKNETITGNVSLNTQTTIDAEITKVEYYWDNKLFSATSLPPYRFSYSPANESVGEHELKFVVYTTSDVGDFSSTRKCTVIITNDAQ